MKLEKAKILADRAKFLVEPYAKRVEIAGSIRREKPEVKDIELVAEMRMEHDIFGERTVPPYANIEEIRAQFQKHGTKYEKGGMRYMQLADVFGEGIKLDLFMVWPPRQWGAIYLIRTGNANFSEWIMKSLLSRGYRCQAGQICELRTGTMIETPTERDVFKLAGVSYREPTMRFGWKKG